MIHIRGILGELEGGRELQTEGKKRKEKKKTYAK